MMLLVLWLALALVTAVLVGVYTRPPTRSAVALRRRMDELEESTDRDHVQLTRLIKRYRALEGHVYGSMEPADDEPAPAAALPDSPQLELHTPRDDFPEDAFQAELARRRGVTRA